MLSNVRLLESSQLTSVSAVKKIVYSTCSIHPEEDEQVVMKALASKEGKARGWTLAPRSMVLPKWHRRGRPAEMSDDEGTQLGKR